MFFGDFVCLVIDSGRRTDNVTFKTSQCQKKNLVEKKMKKKKNNKKKIIKPSRVLTWSTPENTLYSKLEQLNGGK